MTCRGLIARLPELSRGGRRHLAHCGSCAAYRRSYETTVRLAGEAFRAPDEAEMPEALVGEILAAARTRVFHFRPRTRYLVHLLAGVAAGPLLAFCLR